MFPGQFFGSAGVFILPMLGQEGRGAGQPFLVVLRFQQPGAGKVFFTVLRRTAQRLEQSTGHQNWQVVRPEPQVGGSLLHIQAGGQPRQIQQFFEFVVHNIHSISPNILAKIPVPQVYPVHKMNGTHVVILAAL